MPYVWEKTPSYAPTPGFLDREYTPSIICPLPDPDDINNERSSSLHEYPSDQQVGGRDGNAWDEQSSDCIHYQIEWKVKLNNRVLVKDTKQDLTLRPSSYWEEIKSDASKIVRRKIARTRRVRLDDTVMVLSVNSQRNIDKHFEGTSVDWQDVEKQLLAWAHLFYRGKTIRLQIAINFIDDSGSLPSSTDKRGRSSVTKRMLAERDAQIDAEHASGHDPVWRDLYRIMRCPGPPCRHEGQYCWQDPEGKKHYRLRTQHLKDLIRYVEEGALLDTHDDVPDTFRQQLYEEEDQRLEKKKSSNNSSNHSTCPPININNNILPAGSSQIPLSTLPVHEAVLAKPDSVEPITIHGFLDVAVNEYTEWQQSRVTNETFRENINKARAVTLENCLDLMQIYEDQDPSFFSLRMV